MVSVKKKLAIYISSKTSIIQGDTLERDGFELCITESEVVKEGHSKDSSPHKT